MKRKSKCSEDEVEAKVEVEEWTEEEDWIDCREEVEQFDQDLLLSVYVEIGKRESKREKEDKEADPK